MARCSPRWACSLSAPRRETEPCGASEDGLALACSDLHPPWDRGCSRSNSSCVTGWMCWAMNRRTPSDVRRRPCRRGGGRCRDHAIEEARERQPCAADGYSAVHRATALSGSPPCWIRRQVSSGTTSKPASSEDRAKGRRLWPDPIRKGRKFRTNVRRDSSAGDRECAANTTKSGDPNACMACRRSPVRARLAPSHEAAFGRPLSCSSTASGHAPPSPAGAARESSMVTGIRSRAPQRPLSLRLGTGAWNCAMHVRDRALDRSRCGRSGIRSGGPVARTDRPGPPDAAAAACPLSSPPTTPAAPPAGSGDRSRAGARRPTGTRADRSRACPG